MDRGHSMPPRFRPRTHHPFAFLLVAGAFTLFLLPLVPTSAAFPGVPPTLAPAASLSVRALPGRPVAPLSSSGGPLEWANLTPFEATAPSPRGNYGIAYDTSNNVTVLFGGQSTRAGGQAIYDDTWLFVNGTWQNITATAGTPPSPRYDMSMAYDPGAQEVILFGGYGTTSTASGYLNDTWAFQNGSWSNLSIPGPAPRYEAGLVWDPADKALLLFGGAGSVYYNDTWEFSNNTWNQIYVRGNVAPPVRREAALAYDGSDNEAVLFGGVNSLFEGYRDTWTYAKAQWTHVAVNHTAPSARWAVYSVGDPAVSGVLLFGGCTSQGCASVLNDTWVFSGGNWTKRSGFSAVPPARGSNPLAYELDGAGGVADVVFFGGAVWGGTLGDTWVFTTGLFAGLMSLHPRVDVGELTTFTTSVTGGTRPLTYQYSGLPAGCTSANASSLSCTPTTAGNVTVRATVTDPNGTTAQGATNLSVYPMLEVVLTGSRGRLEVGQPVELVANGSGGYGAYAYRYLGLPAGCYNADTANITCVPGSAGTYNVTVQLTDSLFSVVSLPLTLRVDPRLGASASLSLAETEVGEATWLNVSVTSGPGPWNFTWTGLPCGVAWGPAVRCAATVPGGYDPVVEVTDADGATVNLTTPLWNVVVNPVLQLSPNSSIALTGTGVSFVATPTGGIGPYTYVYRFGDGITTSSTSGTVNHEYVTSGTFLVSATVTDAHGFSATAFGNVSVVTPLAVALAPSVPTLTVGTPVTLRATTVGGAAPFTVLWSSLPPGCQGTARLTLNCTPEWAGAYTPQIRVSDQLGETPLASASVFVNARAVVTVNATSGSGCVPATATFSGQVTKGGTAPFTYSWAFGDGTMATGPSAPHTYRSNGTYVVRLTVRDASNASSNATYTFTAAPAGTCSGAPASSGALLIAAGIGLVVLVVAVSAVVVLRRRRPPPPTAWDEDPAAAEPDALEPTS